MDELVIVELHNARNETSCIDREPQKMTLSD